MGKSRLFLALMLLLSVTVHAQTAKWMVEPEYDNISYYSKDLFKTWDAGKMQLLDRNGNYLLPRAVDSVTDYADGYALVLDRSGSYLRIVGFFTEKGHQFQAVNGEYYTNRYSHFSEGMLSVNGPDGKAGYIDNKGNLVIPCQYADARPFLKGWASVKGDDKKVNYIDQVGRVMVIKFHYGDLTMGTNFNQKGEAMVANYQDCAIIDVSGEVVGKYKKKGKKVPVRTYDYSFDEDFEDIPGPSNAKPAFEQGMETFAYGGKLGYKVGEKVMLKPQFTDAKLFADGMAIAALDGRYGILTRVNGDVSVDVKGKNIMYVSSKSVSNYTVSVDVPSGIDPASVSLNLDCGDGDLNPVELKKGKYTFKPVFNADAEAERFTVKAEVYSDGLLLSDVEKDFEVNYVRISVSKPKVTKEYADDKDTQKAVAYITNHSKNALDVSVSLTATVKASGNSVQPTSRELKIEAGETKEISITFKVVEQESVKVNASATIQGISCGSSESTITLKPFY